MKTFKEEATEILKEEGLDAAEDTIAAVARAGFKIAKLAIVRSKTKVDDIILLPTLKYAEPKVMELIDKIDGEKG